MFWEPHARSDCIFHCLNHVPTRGINRAGVAFDVRTWGAASGSTRRTMRITHKIAAALVVVLIALLSGAAIILHGSMRSSFARLEAEVHERNQTRVEANLATVANDVRARVTDYAYWDDTYAFMQGANPAYTDDLNDAWLRDYGVDIVIFADESGEVLWSSALTEDGEAVHPAGDAARLIQRLSPRVVGRAARTGVVWTESYGFLMLSAARATRSDGGGEPTGLVIMGKRISGAFLTTQTQLRVELQHAPSGALEQRFGSMRAGDQESWTDARTIHTLTALRGPFGERAGAMITHQPREAMALGSQSINLALALFAGVLIVGLAALWFLLRALVVQRIERLEAHLQAQGESLEPLPLPADKRPDELTRLAQEYNALITRLNETDARERAALLQGQSEAAANRMKSDFLANVSHELRRPLDAIIGYTELIAEELEGTNATHVRADLHRVSTSARRLLTLITEILDLSRIDVGRLEMRPESFQVATFVRALDLSAMRNGANRVEIVGDLDDAYTDRRRLHQCITSVMTCLRDLSPQAQIILKASRFDKLLRFEITAEGVTLSPDALASAQCSANGQPPLGRAVDGSLALAVAQRLLRLMGGGLEARNSMLGATFVLTVHDVLPENYQRPANENARTEAA